MNAEHYYPEKVAGARRKIGTQKAVAEKLKVTPEHLSRAENGKTASFELLAEIAALASVDIKDFLRPTKTPE